MSLKAALTPLGERVSCIHLAATMATGLDMLGETTVLAVAQNPEVGALMREALLQGGVGRAVRAGVGGDTMSAIAEHCPDCLFVLMDARTGALMEALRDRRRCLNPYLPVVGLLAAPSASAIRGAIAIGVHEVLALPFKAADLAARIGRTVFVGRPFIETPAYFGPCRRRWRDPKYPGPDRRAEDADEAWSVRSATEHRATAFVSRLG